MKQTEVITKEFSSACIVHVEAETTGYCGGDRGHGGFTRIRIKDLASTSMSADVVSNLKGESFSTDEASEIVITFYGDEEQHILAHALTWLGKRLSNIYANPSHT